MAIKRIRLLLAGIFLFTLILLLALAGRPQVLKLPNGATVELLGATTPGKPTIRIGPDWDNLLGWIPLDLREKLALETREYETRLDIPIGVLILLSDQEPSPRFLLSGEDGIEVPGSITHARISNPALYIRNARYPHLIEFNSIPRSARHLTLGIAVQQDNGSLIRVGEFVLPAVKRSTHPMYTASPVPQSKKMGELEVRLQSLRISPVKKSQTYSEETLATEPEAIFEIGGEENSTDCWVTHSLIVSDDTSVQMPCYVRYASPVWNHERKFSTQSISFGPYPAPNKPWKLIATFARQSSFAPEELVTFEQIPIPRIATHLNYGEMQEVNGSRVTLSGIRTEIDPATNSRSAWISLHPSSDSENTIITPLSCRSSDRQDMRKGPWRAGVMQIEGIPADVDRISATFAVHKAKIFEFIAKPELVELVRE